MTPADEAHFIALWQQGRTSAEIAQALGIPMGTVSSRAHTLQQQGKIQPRPRGGAYPRQQAQGRQQGTTPPVQSSAEQSGADSPPTALVPSPAVASAAIIDLLRQTLARLDTVEQDLKAIREDRHPTGAVQSSAEQSGAALPALSPEEAKAERWNLWLPRGLRQRIEAVAKARGHAPSKVVQEILWKALTDRR
jgi:DNA-binding transcriptional MocR family regulator